MKFEAEPETYFTLAYSIRYNQKKMKKMEKEYTAMKTKEQEELVELKVCFSDYDISWLIIIINTLLYMWLLAHQ